MKPLFIPLKSEHYEAFANGTKTTELRIYGPHWNLITCPIGRPVTLSKGYGKSHRLHGHIYNRFRIPRRNINKDINLPFPGEPDQLLLAIHITLDSPLP